MAAAAAMGTAAASSAAAATAAAGLDLSSCSAGTDVSVLTLGEHGILVLDINRMIAAVFELVVTFCDEVNKQENDKTYRNSEKQTLEPCAKRF